MPMSLHNIRVDDQLWDAAMARAADEDTKLSVLIRKWLENYVGGIDAAQRQQERIAALTTMSDALKILKSER